ncbi:hypothetical protein [Streptomyces sp. 4N124]|uniref:hypothetical protein n=1 Tax=Streptomyces sp. 4N124 TaxID=3457420 RepID=UPI003FD51813
MTNRPRVEIVGVMLGLSAMTLTDPFVHSWWPGMLIAVSVAALGAFVVGHAVNNLPLVPAARLATVTTVIIYSGGIVAAVIAWPRANTGQEVAIVLAGYVMLRLIGATVDRLTSWVNISLIASFVGTAVGLSTIPLVLVAHPDLSVWAVLGIGAGVGYMEGVITGFALRTGSTSAR